MQEWNRMVPVYIEISIYSISLNLNLVVQLKTNYQVLQSVIYIKALNQNAVFNYYPSYSS